MSERVMSQVVLWSTVVLGVAGAALGASFFNGLGFGRTLIIVAFCGLLGIALALLGLPGEEAPEPQPVSAAPPAPLALPPAPVRATVPAPAPVANSEWWTQTAKPATSPQADQVAKKAVPLADFDAHRAQIAQCPNCAGFELDVRRDGQACAFTCRNPHCRTTWEWRPGTAWPPTVVRHNLTSATSVEEKPQ
jgi:hypothetical protein